MGVRGLSTFVDNNQQLLTHHRLHDTRVIIDGNNLMYFLLNHYHVAQQFGGDYDRYARKCKHFFKILRQCRIIPFIVFDGGYAADDRKLATLQTRAKEKRDVVRVMCIVGRGCVLPILAVETFRQVLVELRIAHVSCQFEADKEIAVLAKKWGCPVISNDSDFFVYDLKGGVMPFDYINTTLCVYDTQTEKESVYNVKQTLTEHQLIYIPVKLYKSERFLKHYCENVSSCVLPMLGTLLGNDFIDVRDLSTFYATLSIPRKKESKFRVPKEHTRMIAVLHWLESLDDIEKGLENVVAHAGNVAREKLREKLTKSVEDYQNLEEFSSLNLVEFFDGRRYVEEMDCDKSEQTADTAHGHTQNCVSERVLDADDDEQMLGGVTEQTEHSHQTLDCRRIKISEKVREGTDGAVEPALDSVSKPKLDSVGNPDEIMSELEDYSGASLPQWFVDRLATCKIAPFLQNIAVLHRVIFNCQVEMLHKPSSYKCSMALRQVMYGILMKPVKHAKEGDDLRKTHVVEYDRERMGSKKNYIMPVREVTRFGALPDLCDIGQESETNKTKLLFYALGVPKSVVDGVADGNTCMMSTFLVAVAAYWINNAGPKVSSSHLNSLLVCLLFLHLKCFKWMDDKTAINDCPKASGLHADIVTAYKNSSKAQLEKFRTHAVKYLVTPEHSAKRPRENHVVHGFAQFQSCLQAAIHLNQLLLCPVHPPSPSLIFSGTFAYNLCRDLHRRPAPDLYIKEILGYDSPFLNVFLTLRTQVLALCAGDTFKEAIVEISSGKKSKAKKGKKKTGLRVKGRTEKVVHSSSDSDLEDEENASEDLEFDPNNRFALLTLDD